jgi:CubicO group peptidase (beta-lactamase class C family)
VATQSLEEARAQQCDKKIMLLFLNAFSKKGIVLESDSTGLPVMSSYGFATPRDWARWGHLQLQSEWAKQTSKLVDVSLTTGKKKPYGGGVWLDPFEPHSSRFYAEGFEFQYVMVNFDKNLVIVHLACARGDAYASFKDEFENKLVRAVENLL